MCRLLSVSEIEADSYKLQNYTMTSCADVWNVYLTSVTQKLYPVT